MKRLRKPISISLGTLVSAVLPFLPFSVPLVAQEAEPEPKTAPGPGCVWKLSDGDNTIYLAGSVHLLREKDYPLPESYDLAYADSAKVIFEIDMADLSSVEGARKMQVAGMYGADDALKNHVTEETFDRIIDYFASRSENPVASQLAAPILDRMKPGFIFLMISAIEAQELGAKPELGLETEYFKKAVRDEKPTGGLETIEYQMSRFDELTPEEMEEMINETLDELDEMPKVINEMIGAWRSGNIKALDKLMNEQMEEEKPIRELLLDERNQNWIPEIEKALEGSENVMFLVGAAHLVGKGSVVDLLRKKGYKIKRVKPAAKPKAKPAELKKAA